MRLVRLALALPRRPAPLRPRIEAMLQHSGLPLRWAITGVDADQLHIEAVVMETDRAT
jgi:hypothetical protein